PSHIDQTISNNFYNEVKAAFIQYISLCSPLQTRPMQKMQKEKVEVSDLLNSLKRRMTELSLDPVTNSLEFCLVTLLSNFGEGPWVSIHPSFNDWLSTELINSCNWLNTNNNQVTVKTYLLGNFKLFSSKSFELNNALSLFVKICLEHGCSE